MTEEQIQSLLREVEKFIRQASKTQNGWSVEITGKQSQAHLKQTEQKKI